MDVDIHQKLIIERDGRLHERVLHFFPHFFSAVIILLPGLLLGKGYKTVFSRFFKAINRGRGLPSLTN
jgi:hypothetical protein